MRHLESQDRPTEIDSDTFMKILRDSKELGTKAALFIGGEPLIRKDLFDLTAYAKGLGLGTIIVTNGVLLDGSNAMKCFESGVDWLSISIDAASEESFSKIRGEDVLGKIVANVRSLNELKKQRRKRSPKVVAVCTIMNDNLEELLDVVRLCRQLEIERVLFQPVVTSNIDQTQRDVVSPGLVPPGRIELINETIGELIRYKKSSLQNFDFIANSIGNLRLITRYFKNRMKPHESSCYAGYNRLQIVQEGKVYFCVNQQKNDATFGNIKKDSLKELWFSRNAKFYRRIIRKCKSPCLQWCAYRDEFIELAEIFQKKMFFGTSNKK